MYGLLVSARPFYLPGGLLLYVLGVLVGPDPIQAWAVAMGLVLVTLIHALTHFVNDAEDVATDNATDDPTMFTGGSRAIQRGLTTVARLRHASWAIAVIVVALIIAMALAGDWIAALLFGAILLLSYSYSGPPLMLGRYGLGELTAAGVMAFLVPLAGSCAAGGFSAELWPLVALLFAQTFFARMCTAYPDIEADRATGKWTLTALLGERGSAYAFLAVAFANFLAGAVVGTAQLSSDARLASGSVVALAAGFIAILIATKRAKEKRVVVPMIGLGGTSVALLIVTIAYL
jgi:1,4-dihydroxy-2-naphthoate polyprenyltransferase